MRPAVVALLALAASASAGAALCAEDRYGPPSPDAGAVQAPSPAGYLNWPSKAQAGAPAPIYARASDAYVRPSAALPTQTPGAQSIYRDTPAAPSVPASPAPSAWSAYAPPAAAASPAASPAAPVVAAASQPMAGQVGAPPRIYSVGRQYGEQPDPIALSPQFLADSASADLAAPPPPPPERLNTNQTANMSAAAATNQARAAQQAAEAADAAALN